MSKEFTIRFDDNDFAIVWNEDDVPIEKIADFLIDDLSELIDELRRKRDSHEKITLN